MTEDGIARLRGNVVKWLQSDNPARRAAAREVEKAIGELLGTGAPVDYDELDTDACVARLHTAFELRPASPAEARVLKVLLDHPRSTAADLSTHLGADWQAAFAALCQAREDLLWRPQYSGGRDLALPGTILADFYEEKGSWRAKRELTDTLAGIVAGAETLHS